MRQDTQVVERPAAAAEQDRSHRYFLGATLAILALALWVPPITASLWADETTTFWIVKDGFGDMLDRLSRYQGWPPLYFIIVWLLRVVGGDSEILLRLPSVLATAGATYFVYRLGKRFVDQETGLMSAIVFATIGIVVFEAADMRPYALPLMTFAGATLALVRWMDEGRRADAVAYVLTASATLYLHYLFAVPLLIHGLYALYIIRRTHRDPVAGPRRVSLRSMIGVGAAIAILMLPAVPHIVGVLGRRTLLQATWDFPLGQLLASFAPPAVVVGIMLGCVVARSRDPIALVPVRVSVGVPFLAFALTLGPPTVFFLISMASSSTKLIFDRYYIASAVGLALLTGMLIRSIKPRRARSIIVVAVVCLSVITIATRHYRFHADEDWRRAAQVVNELIADNDVPVLAYVGLFETDHPEALTDPERLDYLLSPFSRYPVRGNPIPLPSEFNDTAARHLEDFVQDRLASQRQVILITRFATLSRPFRLWLDARLTVEGFRYQRSTHLGTIEIVAYGRTQEAVGMKGLAS